MGRHREFDPDLALEAALKVFWEKGYEGTSLDDLTRATGVARPGLYSAFGNKADLFLKALDLYEASYMAFMAEALEAPTVASSVKIILDGTAKLVTLSGKHRGCLGVNGALACSQDAEPLRKELIKRRKKSERLLCARMERACEEGELPASTDCVAMASLVMAITQGMAVQAKAGAPRKLLQTYAENLWARWPLLA